MMVDMAPKTKWTVNTAVLVFSLLVVLSCGAELHRKLKTTIICPHSHYCKQSSINLVYTKAVGVNDTLHYLFSTKGTPTVLVVQTNPLGKLLIDWNRFESDQANKSLAFTGIVHYSYAILIKRLMEYDDVNDTADISDPDLNQNPSLWKMHDLSSLKWVNTSQTSNTSINEVTFTVNKNTTEELFNSDSGSLQLKFTVFDDDGRNSLVPHLAFTANTTQIDVSLKNLTTTFNHSRFALEMFMISDISGLQVNSSADLEMSKSIDDEHSPGVFEMIDWTSGSADQTQGGYVQWKPVCYTSSARMFADLNKAKHYKLQHVNNVMEKIPAGSSIAFAFLGYELYSDDVSVSATNVSFGLSKDKFYKHTNYTVWSASFGLGMPPVDRISPMIILVISLGLGLPALLIIFGGIGVTVKRLKGDPTPYGTIN